ncbi:tRNA pseudouridine(38-40) synthase TruA [Halosquirtibacter xylanolyticus]|uniref:tRNA pseudouridine(38-40) synthase TruA n=1 Tax=Halosquirtibacter xylanolyticus TaxID=3374599 RepID=UPI00374922DB|nr:tRNA pseudouridine(38-40) synthase TruA [Prolixibacteraceae bacterium]
METKVSIQQRYFIQLAYNGEFFHGWQIQPNAITVQEELQKALTTISREKIEVTGAGRTDTSVHASLYVAHFDADNDRLDNPNFAYKLNKFLGKGISVQKIFKVDHDDHARFDATHRTYKYFLSLEKDPFMFRYAFKPFKKVDFTYMNEAASFLLKHHDFESFERSGADNKTSVCDVSHAYWEVNGNFAVFTITADRFLRNMVRAIVGTLLDVGYGKLSPKQFNSIIEKRDRKYAGASAPGEALFLVDIGYREEIEELLEYQSQGLYFNPR